MNFRLPVFASFVALLVFSMGACDKGKGAEKEEDTTWTWERCTTEGWDTTRTTFTTCDTLLWDKFADECEWDSVSNKEASRWEALTSGGARIQGIRKLSPRIGQIFWLKQIIIENSDSLLELPPEIWEINRLERIYLTRLWNLKALPEIRFTTNVNYLDMMATTPRLPKTLNKAPLWFFKGWGNAEHPTEFPIEVCGIKTMKILIPRCTLCDSVPDCVTEMKQLASLDLNSASIAYVPEEIVRMPSIRFLYLSSTQITSIPEAVCERPDVEFSFAGSKICNRDGVPLCMDSTTIENILRTQRCN